MAYFYYKERTNRGDAIEARLLRNGTDTITLTAPSQGNDTTIYRRKLY